MKITDQHAKYFAYELTKRCSSNSLEKLSSTLSNAQVDLNPHQIEAALFAFRSPLSKGAILADEVGLGKTIEAGLVLSQKWAERKRNILLIVPSSLRKQWNDELSEKFFLPSIILEARSFNQYIKDGNLNPFNQEDKIIICSYHFARSKSPYIKQTKWDLAVIDEAHRLRNVYKTSNKIAREIKDALTEVPKILLTATPLQNSLLELYGLVSIIDDHVFGDLKSFKANYARVSREQDIYENELGLVEPKQEMFVDLRNRLKPVCIRTLRRQVLEYINYTERKPITQDYVPTEQEVELYDGMSEYLQRTKLYALPFSQRQLMTLILRKLLASSSFAIASTLDKLVYKLEQLIVDTKAKIPTQDGGIAGIEQNFEAFEEMSDEWIDDEEGEDDKEEKEQKALTEKDIVLMEQEKADLERFRNLAQKIYTNSKGDALLTALKKGFEMTAELGAKKKAIIFTESTITQRYLAETLLGNNGYKDKIVLFNGSNNDDKSKEIYKNWLAKNKDTDKITGSKTADTRAALIEYFKDEAEIMIATEAGAEGVNLQFCSLVINYDLPWNPQRIEQRIGRCHRYGQKHDVVVINFVNRKNAADQRVYELLDQKFKLFKGVFGASDEVLGSIESGVDFEKRIAGIYQTCRTADDINTAFDKLQEEMDESIQSNLSDTRQKLLENFDAEVHEKLKLNQRESQSYLDTYERWLWDVTRYYLGDNADFAEHEYSFSLKVNPFQNEDIDPGPYKIGKNVEDAHVYRPGHSLAQRILNEVKNKQIESAEIVFDYSNHSSIISVLEPLVGKHGTLKVSNYTVEAFEKEDAVVVSALDNNGEPIERDIIKKLFSLSAQSVTPKALSPEESTKLDELEQQTISIISGQIAERNSEFFDDEVDKLDNWSDDVKKGLELDLRKLDIDIKTAKTNAKKIVNLEEKLKAQREIKDSEKKRNEMRRKLYEAQDEVEIKKEKLLEGIEAQLKQKSQIETLFTISWKII
ncbi:MAG: helicase subunit of dna repair complex [Parcubacteria group bacterium GW2011_GWA1_47_8]|nr:MAG: helicase subunit of dna repair complex [Parcubacteria group bacterium GW2011_GWA1_47_8]